MGFADAVKPVPGILSSLDRAVVGYAREKRLILASLISGGHVLLEGVPGIAKTTLVKALARTLGLLGAEESVNGIPFRGFSRVQLTPDLMPSDITGSLVYNPQTRDFEVRYGPLFAYILLADEINRATPRTQSALLEAMQERQVTIGKETYKLEFKERGKFFFVAATQNPVEQEGTYPLPEAQLDRFLMQIDVMYPDLESERRMLLSTTGETVASARNAMSAADLMAAQRLVRRVPVGEKVVNAILDLVRAARPEEGASEEVERHVAWGPGPRASQALMLAVRARALIDGRFSPSIEDVKTLAAPVLRHRMALNFSARAEGVTVSGVIDRLCRTIG